uniref:Uncharacterized protein n=1 Tax=Arion vulgaris TaxID=1028688 RepID=A0A0B7AY16_9EUPU
MVTSNKTSTRSPGRTPPFILIGLLLLLGFLGYSYWSLNNANAVLSVELEAVRIQKKDTDQINFESEKNIAYTKKGLIDAQDNLNNARKQLRSKDSELTSVKSDLSTKQMEAEKLRIEKNECDINFSDLKTKLEGLQGENDKLKQQLEEEKAKPVVCDVVSCKSSVKEILGIVAKAFGSAAVKKTLSEANLDASTFMEGIDFPAPVVPQQQDPKLQEKVPNPLDKDPNPQQQAPNPQQQAPNPQQQAPNPQEQTPNQQQQAPKQQTLSEVSLQQAANKNEQDKAH